MSTLKIEINIWHLVFLLLISIVLSSLGAFLLIINREAIKTTVRNQFNQDINIALPLSPVNVAFNKHPIGVHFRIPEPISIPIKDSFKVPIRVQTHMPVDMKINVISELPIDTNVKIKQALTPSNFTLKPITIKLDSKVRITDNIPISQTIPVKLTTRVMGFPIHIDSTMPLDMVVPIDKEFKISGEFPIEAQQFEGLLDLDVPFQSKIKINSPMRIKADVPVNFAQTFEVPFEKTFTFNANQNIMPGFVTIDHSVPVSITDAHINLKELLKANPDLIHQLLKLQGTGNSSSKNVPQPQ